MLRKLLQATAIIATLSMTGCVSYNVTGPLGAPQHPAASTSPRTAQVADVAVTAPGIDEATRKAISRSLTAQLDQYVEAGKYFKQVSEYPTRLDEQDVMLKFNMTSLKGHRGPHPGYVPGALLTLTVWIWVNGPIYVDSFDVAGDLVIEDRNGKTLASSRQALKLERNVGLYRREYWAPTLGAPQLNEVVAKLLDDATLKLAKQ
ncbi:hypothetical protein ABE525_12415 [Pseudomonas wadenswilerensis]|uniref:Lipoprotein n=1 Tax=Pseudomonas wadenswilerensis TaxID=1785161 RepID=A0A380T183_9PSED|nr:hypothetical protein [Pseudomonas]MCE5983084.1 hypothetical protein [Pseudomonas sp. LF19]UVM19657.1 hypothetical protein LOY45_14430 [Pseudomonas wadenswilerensis]SPO69610.1 putative lipoprotein [Pseudomonas sp. JV241A]SUQ63276.1 hypothetical protein CCOS864_02726 [Pseudomonas wadenswilerensis]